MIRLRILFSIPVLLTVVVCGGAQERKPASPNQPTETRLERGHYLTENLFNCFACHSEMDWASPEPKEMPGRRSSGAPFPIDGLPFDLYVPNISSDKETGAGSWSDEQLARAIREGIGHDGRVLSTIMPYMLLRNLSDGDLAAIIAYVRTIPPIHKPAGPSVPQEVRERFPQPPALTKPVPEPDRTDPVKYGKYLLSVADCTNCHTPRNEKNQLNLELAFSGGMIVDGAWGKATGANITPDESGISDYTPEIFLQMMRTGRVGARKLHPIMPYWRYRNLTESDQRAMFAYLRTLKPIQHLVNNDRPPTFCKVCRGRHGAGDLN